MNDLIEQLTILSTKSVLAAIERMEFSRFQIVFVTTGDRMMYGKYDERNTVNHESK